MVCVSILVSHKLLLKVFKPMTPTDSESTHCKEALNKVGNILINENDHDISVYTTSQALSSIQNKITINLYNKARDFFREETTTRGVANFDPDTSFPESANTLGYEGITIALGTDADRFVPSSSNTLRVAFISITEFSQLYDTFNGNIIDMFISKVSSTATTSPP